MKEYIIVIFVLFINCTGSVNTNIENKDLEILKLAIKLIKAEVEGNKNYSVCNTFVDISYDKVKCSGSEDLIERAPRINNKFSNKVSMQLAKLSTCIDCSEVYFISGFDEKYVFIKYVPAGYNYAKICTTDYSYANLFLFNIETGIPRKICSVANHIEIF